MARHILAYADLHMGVLTGPTLIGSILGRYPHNIMT